MHTQADHPTPRSPRDASAVPFIDSQAGLLETLAPELTRASHATAAPARGRKAVQS